MQSQQELKLGPMPIAGIRFLPQSDVALCDTGQDAIWLAWMRRRPRYSVEAAANAMGVSKGTLSKYLHGSLGMSPDRQAAFERVVGNRAISQYTAHVTGCVLHRRELTDAEQKDQEIADLRAKLAEAS